MKTIKILFITLVLGVQLSRSSTSLEQVQLDGTQADSVAASLHSKRSWRNSSEYRQALKYAPILWFADQEKYFPTLPFFTAFDGINNNSNPLIDFDDPDEIAPTDEEYRGETLASWDSLRARYDRLTDKQKKTNVAVFYKSDSISAKQLEEIFFSDEQFWRRLETTPEGQRIKSFVRSHNARFSVYEYFFYYLNDTGLEGHPEDIEFIFVFVPRDSSQAFRVVIGAGHTAFVPNNVLVYEESENASGSHMHILVELGGHSSAPDLNADGQFNPGVDANWHIENLWGTRDAQAISGRGATGKYDNWMTFPRTNANKIFPPLDSALATQSDSFHYRLLPAEKFKLAASPFHKKFSVKEFPSLLPVLESLVDLDLPTLRSQDSSKSKEVLKRSSLWSQNLLSREPIIPQGWLLSFQLEPRNGFNLHSKVFEKNSHTGNVAGEIRLGGFLPGWYVYPGGRNDAIELQMGLRLQTQEKPRFIAAIYYQYSYVNPASFYVNFSWLQNRIDSSEVAMGLGASFSLPIDYPAQIGTLDFIRRLRLRIGIRIENRKDTRAWKHFSRIAPEIQLIYYSLPFSRFRYEKLDKRKHMVWEHKEYNRDPRFLFKRHLFRPRKLMRFGLWAHYALEKERLPELRLAWLLPVWDPLPIKLDGILEGHVGLKRPWHTWFHNNLLDRNANLVFALYYDRYYSRILSWYGNISWTRAYNARLIDQEKYLDYSLGAGFSLTLPPFFDTPGLTKPIDLFHYVRIRIGFRALFDKKTYRIRENQLEVQLGVHY